MKIIQITASYKPAYIYGGPIQSVAKLCEAIKVKNKIEVLTTTANGKTELAVIPCQRTVVDGVNVRYFKRITKDHTHFSPSLLWNLRKEIKKQQKIENSNQQTKKPTIQPTIIHIHAWWNLVSVLSCLIAKWYKVPVVLSPRGMLTSYTQGNRNSISKKIIHSLIGKKLLKYCHIHATSELEKEDILKIVQPKSITVIPNLVKIVQGKEYQVSSIKPASMSDKYQDEEQNEINDSKRLTNDEKRTSPLKLFFLSRIEEKKGLELLFRALVNLNFPWELKIAGRGDKDYTSTLKTLTKDLSISNKIEWLGQVSDEDKFNLLKQNDLLVLTSYNENFANVVIESLSVGTAVLISEQIGLTDYVWKKELGWITALNPKEIQNTLVEAHSDQNKRMKIRNYAPEIIASDFNDDTLIKRYLKLYQSVTESNL